MGWQFFGGFEKFPKDVQQGMGYALYIAQAGEKHPAAKPLKGFKGAGMLEVIEDFDGDTYRAVYTVRLAGVIYVLHAFQKNPSKALPLQTGHRTGRSKTEAS